MAEKKEKYIVAADLGTARMSLIVVKVNGFDTQVVYYKEVASDGIRYSGVSNMGKAHAPLDVLIKGAETELNIKINHVIIGMPKFPIRQEANSGKLQDRGEDTEITAEDIADIKRFAQDSYVLANEGEAVYGAVAQSFSDSENFQTSEDEIIGMASDVIEGHFNIFIGRKRELKNADALLSKSNTSALKKYFTAHTTAKLVLTENEMDNGVALVDIGGGVTSVTIYVNGIMRHYASIPFGGKNITADIKSELQITERLAENIKLAFGACMPDKLQNMSEKILYIQDTLTNHEKQVPVKYLSDIITARVEEIMEAVLYIIKSSGFEDDIRCGIVLTGGVSKTTNLRALIKEMSGYHARIGNPMLQLSSDGIEGTDNVSAATILGLVMEALDENLPSCAIDLDEAAEKKGIIEEEKEFKVNEPEVKEPEIKEPEIKEPEIKEPEVTEEKKEPAKEVEVTPVPKEEEKEIKETEEKTEEKAEETETVKVKEKKEPWKLFSLVWGKAKAVTSNVTSNVTGLIDNLTDKADDDSEDFDYDE